MSKERKQSTEAAVREIRRRTRRKFSPEEKIRIVLEGLRGEQSVSELCRREDIASNLYYRWSKDFLEAGKKQLAGDTVREATSDEVKDLCAENRELKEVMAEITLKNRVLKKSLTGNKPPSCGPISTRILSFRFGGLTQSLTLHWGDGRPGIGHLDSEGGRVATFVPGRGW